MSNGRGSSELLDLIHGLVAGGIKDELVRAAALAAHEDPDQRVPINPQLIDKAMKFLKDNGIEAPATSDRIDDLKEELMALPDVDVDGVAMDIRLN